jgi:hypothetical protein
MTEHGWNFYHIALVTFFTFCEMRLRIWFKKEETSNPLYMRKSQEVEYYKI